MTPTPNGASAPSRIRLGDLLVKAGVVTDVQLRTALQEQQKWGGKLGDILVRLEYVTEEILVRALAKQLGLSRADLSILPPAEALAQFTGDLADEYELLPIGFVEEGRALAIATSDPLNFTVLDFVRSLIGIRIVPFVAGASALRRAIARSYQLEGHDADGEPRVEADADEATTRYVPSAAGDIPLRPTRSAAAPALPPTPAYGQPVPPMALAYQARMNPGAPAAAADEAYRREVAALKALVELLVKNGVITLDEYLTRLKR